jgi:hypothetical protein
MAATLYSDPPDELSYKVTSSGKQVERKFFYHKASSLSVSQLSTKRVVPERLSCLLSTQQNSRQSIRLHSSLFKKAAALRPQRIAKST